MSDEEEQDHRYHEDDGVEYVVTTPIVIKRLNKGCSNMMYACEMGHSSDIPEHLKSQHVQKRDHRNMNAMHYCTKKKNIIAAANLASTAPELLDSPDDDGLTPLHLAVIQGNMELLKMLLASKVNVNALDNECHSVVHWATVCGEVEALRAVLEAGANISTADIHGGSPLHYAAQMCGVTSVMTCPKNYASVAFDILNLILHHPETKVNVVDMDKRQPLLWASSSGSAKAILALVKSGAKVESFDKDGLTAIHCAASRGHTECIDTLINLCGSPTDLTDKNGCTALHYAVALGHIDCVALLLDLKANPNHQDLKGRTPAHCGCAKGQFETVKILRDRGNADLWLQNAKGDLPIHDAAISGRRKLVEWLLLQKQNQVNVSSNDGRTLLHIAAENNYTDMCKMLLDAGADINSIYQTSENIVLTPLDCSLTRSFRSTAKFLQFHGGLPASKLRISSQSSKVTGVEQNIKTSLKPTIASNESRKCGSSKKVVIYVDGSNSDSDECKSNTRVHSITKLMDKMEQKRRKRKQHILNRRYRTKSFNIYLRRNSSSDESKETNGNTDQQNIEHQPKSDIQNEPCTLLIVENDPNEVGISPDTNKDDQMTVNETEPKIKNADAGKTAADTADETVPIQNTEIVTGDKKEESIKSDPTIEGNTDKEINEDPKSRIDATESKSNDETNVQELLSENIEKSKNNDMDSKPTDYDGNDCVKQTNEKDIQSSENEHISNQDIDENTIKTQADTCNASCSNQDNNDDKRNIKDDLEIKKDTFSTVLQADKMLDKCESVPQIAINVGNSAPGEITSDKDNTNPLDNKLSYDISENENDHISKPTEDTTQRKTSFTVLDSLDDVEMEPSFEVIQNKSDCQQISHDRTSSADDEYPVANKDQHANEFQKNGSLRGESRRPNQHSNTNEQQLVCSKDLDSGIEPSPRANMSSPQSTSSVDKSKRVLQKRWTANTHRKECKQASKKSEINMSTVSLSLQEDINRFYMERQIFQHLLELKSLQIRSSKVTESILVKRAVDDYHNSTLFPKNECVDSRTGDIKRTLSTKDSDPTYLRRYPFKEYTFKKFELHLYETLKSLQKSNSRNFQNISDVYKEAERRNALDKRSVGSALHCTTKTHRCLHAAHAYTGIPCAAYIPMMNHHTMPKYGFGPAKNRGLSSFYLPEISTLNSNTAGSEYQNSKNPKPGVSVEVSHGLNRKSIYLPTNKMDRNKRYYVTLSVKDAEKTDS